MSILLDGVIFAGIPITLIFVSLILAFARGKSAQPQDAFRTVTITKHAHDQGYRLAMVNKEKKFTRIYED